VKEAEVYEHHCGDGRKNTDDGDEDNRAGAGAGHRQQRWHRCAVIHARRVPCFVPVIIVYE